MRIISGYLKGKNIELPADKDTRPLKDIVKESIFNIIYHSNNFDIKIENSKILDLFSGTGSFGLECISRGASKVIFCENYPNALNVLNQNISNLKCENKCQIKSVNIYNLIEQKQLEEDNFDIIFIDPPYKEKKIFELINNIKKNNILKKDGIIIIHRHKKENDKLPENFNTLDIRIYGLSKIIFGN